MTNLNSCWPDHTYCVSPNCTNGCGRKLTDDMKKELEKIKYSNLSMAYFCGEPE